MYSDNSSGFDPLNSS